MLIRLSHHRPAPLGGPVRRLAALAVRLGAALVFAVGAPAQAQEPTDSLRPGTGIIAGRIVAARTRAPIPDAQLSLDGTDRRATASSDGRFRFAGVPAGIYALRAAAIGYRPQVLANVVVSPGKPADVEVVLSEAPVELAELTAAPSFFLPPQDAPTSTQSLGAEDVRRSPGAQEDVVRAISLLPGVGVTTGGRNDLVVRGGAPTENLFLVDNLEVPNINHFGTQGATGGPVSLINIDFVRQADFSAGGFGPRFGDRVGSVTAIGLRDGTTERSAFQGNFSATGFGVLAEGPLGRSGGSFLASVRRSYLDLIFSLVGFNFRPAYWDANLKLTQPLGARDRLSWLFVGGLDDLTFNNDDADNRFDNARIIGQSQDQYFTGLTWSRSGGSSLLQITLGRTFAKTGTFQNDTLLTRIFENRSTEAENSLRADLTLTPSSRVSINLGTIAKYADRLAYAATIPGEFRRDAAGTPQPLAVDTSFTAFRQAAYAELALQPSASVRVTLGGRADYYDYLDGAFRAAPRVGASIALDARTTLNASVGRYWQSPSLIWLSGDPGNAARLAPFRADQAVLGVQRLLREDLKLQVEGYVKGYGAYPARLFRPQAVLAPSGFDNAQTDIPFGLEPLASTGTGRSYGGEIFVQKKLSRSPVYGIGSLSLNRSEFRGIDGVLRPGRFDTRMIVSTAAGWRPNSRWELGGRFRLATGAPSTPFVESGALAGTLDFARYNAGPRLPTFHALDVRVDRRWSYRGTQLTLYLDVQNVYARKNVDGLYFDQRLGRGVLDESGVGVLPTIGVNFAF